MAIESKIILITPWIVHVVMEHWLSIVLGSKNRIPRVPHFKVLLKTVTTAQKTTKAIRPKQTQ